MSIPTAEQIDKLIECLPAERWHRKVIRCPKCGYKITEVNGFRLIAGPINVACDKSNSEGGLICRHEFSISLPQEKTERLFDILINQLKANESYKELVDREFNDR